MIVFPLIMENSYQKIISHTFMFDITLHSKILKVESRKNSNTDNNQFLFHYL